MNWWQVVGWTAFGLFGLPVLLFFWSKAAAMGWRRGQRACDKKERDERFQTEGETNGEGL